MDAHKLATLAGEASAIAAQLTADNDSRVRKLAHDAAVAERALTMHRAALRRIMAR